MTENQQNLEEVLFELAEQKSTAADRAAFLDGVCRDNPALRARLEVLLECHFGAEEFLTQNPKSSAPSRPVPAPQSVDRESRAAENSAQMIGRYKLLEKI